MVGLPGLMKRADSEPLRPAAQPPSVRHAASRSATGRSGWSTTRPNRPNGGANGGAPGTTPGKRLPAPEERCSSYSCSFLPFEKHWLADDLTKEHPDELNDGRTQRDDV